MNSLFKKQLFLTLSIVLLSFSILSIGVLIYSRSHIESEIERTTRKNTQVLAAFTSAYVITDSIEDSYYQGYVKAIALVTDAYVYISDMEGKVIYASDGNYFYPMQNRNLPDELVDEVNLDGNYEKKTNLGGIFADTRYVYAEAYTDSESSVAKNLGIIVISGNVERLNELWDGIGSAFSLMVIVVVALTLVCSSYVSARQVKPLNDLAAVARRFGQGELTAKSVGYENRTDEIGALAREFNAMATSLARSEQQRTDFINNVSHELKTPMTTISGFAEGLMDGTVSPQHRDRSIEIILKETRRLARLVQQMLNLSRIEVGRDEPLVQEQFDLIELLAQVIISMEQKILSRNLDLSVDIPEGELWVWGNRDSLTQVCYNLIDNATKFSIEGTTITISAVARERKAYVSVQNYGDTIDAKELPLLFERFHKHDSSRSAHPEGLGLGLYLVKTILSKLDQGITVTSVDGKTQFVFTLSLI